MTPQRPLGDQVTLPFPSTEPPSFADETHCRHGVYTGPKLGADYMCQYCEGGYEPSDLIMFCRVEPTNIGPHLIVKLSQYGEDFLTGDNGLKFLHPYEAPFTMELMGANSDLLDWLVLEGFEPPNAHNYPSMFRSLAAAERRHNATPTPK